MKNSNTKLLTLAITIAGVVAIAVITIGVLATPIIMAIKFSWYWLFLYVGYLLAALYLAVYAVIKSGSNSR